MHSVSQAKRSSLHVVTWNINGWRSANRRGLREWIDDTQPDILCLQETRLSKQQVDQLRPSVPGYAGFFFSGPRPGYSGTAILTKKAPIAVGAPGVSILDNEGRALVAEFDHWVVVNAYVPNGNRSVERLRYKHDFLRALSEFALSLSRLGKSVLLCGDFNTAHTYLDLSASPSRAARRSGFLATERGLLDTLLNLGWCDTYRALYPDAASAFTWWAAHSGAKERNAGWRFDYIFMPEISSRLLQKAWMSSSIRVSDHCPFAVELNPVFVPTKLVSTPCALVVDDVFECEQCLL